MLWFKRDDKEATILKTKKMVRELLLSILG
jgi:hypothetical protein